MWIIYALAAAIFGAIYNLSAQNIKLDNNTFMVYRGLTIFFVLLPVFIFYPLVFDWRFYLISIIQGVTIAYIDFIAFKINQKYGSEVVSAITPLSVVLTFFIWCLITPSIVVKYYRNINLSCLILIAVFGIVFSLMKYQQVKFTRQALIKMLPIVYLTGFLAVLNKVVMFYGDNNKLLCACQNVLISSLIVGFIHLYIYRKKDFLLKKLISLQNIKKSAIFLFLLLLMVFKQCAMYQVENPAYVSCLFYSIIAWVMLFSRYIPILKFRKANLQGPKKWKLLFFFSIVLLIWATK